MRHALFPLEELGPGHTRPVTVAGVDLVIVRGLDGPIHALRDRCAHAGAPLSKGRLLKQVDGDDVDQYRLIDKAVLRCPWHGYEYDLATGRCLADPKHVRVRTYAVVAEDGMVCVDMRAG